MALTYSKEELESLTTLYDKFYPTIEEKAKNPATFRKIILEIQKFTDKNKDKLFTNIVGRQVLINSSMENNILDAIGINKNDVKDAIKNSPYFEKFGELQLTDQLAFAIPLILYAIMLAKNNKKEESEIVYLTTFFKPYASRESQHFKYGVNEGQMLYTIEMTLTDRFDLKRLGSIYEMLVKMASSSYDNYIERIKNDKKVSDRELHVIYTSGVTSRVNNTLAGIYSKYKENAGKSLDFEANATGVLDKDNDEIGDFTDSNIQSVAAVKQNLVDNVVNRIFRNPIDTKLVAIAAQAYFRSSSKYYRDIITNALSEIMEKMPNDIPIFISSLIGSFLFNINPLTGVKYTVADLKSPLFLRASMDIFKKPGTKDANMLKVRELLNKMLESHSTEYINFGKTKRYDFKNALFFYFVLLVKEGGR